MDVMKMEFGCGFDYMARVRVRWQAFIKTYQIWFHKRRRISSLAVLTVGVSRRSLLRGAIIAERCPGSRMLLASTVDRAVTRPHREDSCPNAVIYVAGLSEFSYFPSSSVPSTASATSRRRWSLGQSVATYCVSLWPDGTFYQTN
jgi:hypothetical protein